MKRLLFYLFTSIAVSLPNVLKSQFVTTQYYTGNTTISTDFIKGGVAIDTNNNKWFGTDMGVLKFNGTTWTSYTMANGLPSDIISCITVDKNNNVWVGTEGDGVARFDGSGWMPFTVHSTNNGIDSLCDNGIYDIAGDLNGHVWFASKGNGVSEYDGSVWKTYTTGLPVDGVEIAGVNFIQVDGDNNKWFGTDMGLAKYDGANWTIIDVTSMDSLIDNKITSIAIDASGNKWLGTGLGITKLSAANLWVKNYRIEDGLYTHYVADLDFDRTGNLWIGLFTDYNNDGGITEFTGNSWHSEQIDFPDSVSADQIFRIAVDENNDVWIAMDYGVVKVNHGTGIRETYKYSNLEVFPNPAIDIIFIKIDNRESLNHRDVKIFNGCQVVKTVALADNQSLVQIPVDDLPCGLYFVMIGNQVQKFIINR